MNDPVEQFVEMATTPALTDLERGQLDYIIGQLDKNCAEHGAILDQLAALTAAVNQLGTMTQAMMDMAASVAGQFQAMNPAAMLKGLIGGKRNG